MNIVIRTDASDRIKTGHVMRCLTLAESLKQQGADILFVMREQNGDLIALAQQRGFKVESFKADENISWKKDAELTTQFLPEKYDCIIVDHYDLDEKWEKALRVKTKHMMVIDDLADRKHDCDILLDQNLHPQMQSRYTPLAPKNCRMFLGPQYALLRPEFYQARARLRKRAGDLNNILVSFGGGSQPEILKKTLQAAENLKVFSFDIVLGMSDSKNSEIQSLKMPHVRLHSNVQNMAELMSRADLAIGAGGTTTWERCFLGLPSLVVVLADNQLENAQAVERAGIALNLGWQNEIEPNKIAQTILSLKKQPEILRNMSLKALELTPSLDNPLIAFLKEALL